MTPAEQMDAARKAGFSEDEIAAWVGKQQEAARQAGFSEDEIAAHFGFEHPDPAPFRSHFAKQLEGLAAASGQTQAPQEVGAPSAGELPPAAQQMEAKFESSISGLLIRGKNPTTPEIKDPNTFERIAGDVAQILGDAPASALGFMAAGGPASPITGTGGMFALPAALRVMMMDQYANGRIQSAQRFFDVASASLLAEFKGMVVGTATAGSGQVAEALGAPVVAKLAAEIVTLTTLGAAVEGHLPEPRDFIDNTILLGGVKAVSGTVEAASETIKALRNVYARVGVDPAQITQDAAVEPTIHEDVLSQNVETPRVYQSAEVAGDTELDRKNAELQSSGRKLERVYSDPSLSITEGSRIGGKLAEGGKSAAPPSGDVELESAISKAASEIAKAQEPPASLKAARKALIQEAARVAAMQQPKGLEVMPTGPAAPTGPEQPAGRAQEVAPAQPEGPAQPRGRAQPKATTGVQVPDTFVLQGSVVKLTPTQQVTISAYADRLREKKLEADRARASVLAPEALEGAQPKAPTPEEELLARISINEADKENPSLFTTFDKLYTHMVDSKHPLAKAVELMAAGKELPLVEDAYQLSLLRPGTHDMATAFLRDNTFDFKSAAVTGPGLREILSPHGDYLDPLRSYLVARRVNELRARGIKAGVNPATAVQIESRAIETDSSFRQIAQQLYDYQGRVLRYFRESGMISADSERAMKAMNASYAPFYRVLEENVTGGAQVNRGNVVQLLKEIEGSEKIIIDPIENMIRNTYAMVDMAEKNRVMLALVDLAAKSERGADFATKAEGEGSLAPRGTTALPVFRDGVREVWNVDRDIANSIRPLDIGSAHVFFRLAGFPSRTLRAGTVLNAAYAVRNLFRDQFATYIFSEHGAKPFTDMVRGMASIFKNDAMWQEYQRSGAMMSEMVSLDRQYLQKNIVTLMEDGGLRTAARNLILKPIDSLQALSQLSERVTRLGGEFRRAREQGQSIKESGAAARALLDFNRAGITARNINQIAAFFQSTLTGHDKLVRSFADPQTGMRTFRRGLVSITLPTVALYLANRNEDWYKRLPIWRKDLFWNFHAGGITYSLPIPWELGLIFKTIPERIMRSALDQNPHAFDDVWDSISRVVYPSVVPTAGAPVIEQFSNRSIYFNRPIVPDALYGPDGVLPEYQFQSYTTELAKAVGKALATMPGMKNDELASPAMLENYVRGWTGGLGTQVLRIGNTVLQKAGKLPVPVRAEPTLADNPFIGAFVVRQPSADTEEIGRFYKRYESMKVLLKTIHQLETEGDFAAAQRERDIKGGVTFDPTGVSDALSSMNATIRMLTEDDTTAPEVKRQLIDGIYEQMDALAKFGNDMLDRAEEPLPQSTPAPAPSDVPGNLSGTPPLAPQLRRQTGGPLTLPAILPR